jgi:hypothetical protein
MTAPPKSPTLLTELCDRLRALGEHPETEEARAEVEAALQSKWWNLRTVAIGVIGGWGGKANKAWLIERALEAQGHDPGWESRARSFSGATQSRRLRRVR